MKKKVELKEFRLLLKKKWLSYWTKLKEETRNSIIDNLLAGLSNLVNSILLSVPIALYFGLTGSDYVKLVIGLWIFIPYVGHYYTWLRQGWKKEE